MMRGSAAALLTAMACDPGPTDRERFVQAQSLPLSDATDTCLSIRDPALQDDCLLALVDTHERVNVRICAGLHQDNGQADCLFRLAERYAGRGDRWLALEACGLAAPFTDECLYHCWTRELQALIRAATGLTETLAAAKEPVEYWSQLETAGPDQSERVWGDFWYFWWLHHPPASLQACSGLTPGLLQSCQYGTRIFVERSVDQALRDPSRAAQLDRFCRADEPAALPPGVADEQELRAAAQQALDRLCEHGADAPRPWNPVFQARRSR